MVEIIKRGVPRGEVVHDITCRFCKSELRFKEHEAKRHYDQRDGDYLSITCPVCQSVINKDIRP